MNLSSYFIKPAQLINCIFQAYVIYPLTVSCKLQTLLPSSNYQKILGFLMMLWGVKIKKSALTYLFCETK